jgi:hypothetical protein
MGWLAPFPRDAPFSLRLLDVLRQRGFIDGQNLAIDYRDYGARVDLVSEYAVALAKGPVDVIQAGGGVAVRAVQQATKTIPICGASDDMVGEGLVNLMAQPTGNTTGVSILASELNGKLIGAVPGLRRMGALADSRVTTDAALQAMQEAARQRNVEVSVHRVDPRRTSTFAHGEARDQGRRRTGTFAGFVKHCPTPSTWRELFGSAILFRSSTHSAGLGRQPIRMIGPNRHARQMQGWSIQAVYRFKSQPDRKRSYDLPIASELQRSVDCVAPFRVAKIDFDVITNIAAKCKIDLKSRVLHADVGAGSPEDQPHDSESRAARRHA